MFYLMNARFIKDRKSLAGLAKIGPDSGVQVFRVFYYPATENAGIAF